MNINSRHASKVAVLSHNFDPSRDSHSLPIKMSEIIVGEYLFRRLKQLGVQTVFGVPGGESSLLQSWDILCFCFYRDQAKGLVTSDIFSSPRL